MENTLENKIKTLPECKEQVAEKHSYHNWDNLCFVWAGFIKQIQPFMDEAAEMHADQFKPKWIHISEYPKNDIPKVLRWHKIHKCLVSVHHRRAYAENGCEWMSGTMDNTWPEEAFEPFFMYQLPRTP